MTFESQTAQYIYELYGQKAYEEHMYEMSLKNRTSQQLGAAIAKEAYEAQQQRKKYERIEKEALDELKTLSEGKTTEYGEFVFSKTLRAGSINYAAIPELLNVRLEEYRKADVESWSLTKR